MQITGAGVNTFHHFTIEPTGYVIAPSGNINVTGNWTNTGVFNSNGGTVTFTGGNLQSISCPSGEVFNNLSVQKSGNEITVGNDFTIASTLTLTSGNIRLGSSVLTLGTSTSNAVVNPATVTDASYIIADNSGYVKHFVNNAGASATKNVNLYSFPIGDGINFTPCAIHLKSATTLNSGAL